MHDSAQCLLPIAIDKILCKLDSTENPRSFEKYPTLTLCHQIRWKFHENSYSNHFFGQICDQLFL